MNDDSQGLLDFDGWRSVHRARDLLHLALLAPISTTAGSLAVTLSLWTVVPHERLAPWLAAALLLAVAEWHIARRIGTPRGDGRGAERNWVVASALAAGLFWGSTNAVLFPHESAENQLLLAFILIAAMALWLPLFAVVRHSFAAFAVPAALPMAFELLTSPRTPQTSMGSLFLLSVAALAVVAQLAGRMLFAETAARRALYHQATHDSLVGLANRAEFHRRVRTVEVMHASYAIVFIDLDHFKTVNDTAGHAAGDELLRRIGEVLRLSARHGDTAARLGGDEFAILMEGCGAAEAALVAATILKRVRAFRFIGERQCPPVTASIGIACSADLCATPAKLLEAADQACYRAKRAGRNRVEVATVLAAAPVRLRSQPDVVPFADMSIDLPA